MHSPDSLTVAQCGRTACAPPILAEASARVRLSQTVELQDVERATRLCGRCMRDIGIDPDSGQLDANIIETGNSKS